MGAAAGVSAATREQADATRILLLDVAAGTGTPALEALREAGLGYLTAASVPEALSILRRREIGVVVARCACDLNQTADLLQELRRQAPQVPVVLYGRVDDPATVVAALRSGAADFVADDVDGGILLALLTGYLQGRERGPVFESAASRHSYDLACRVARTDVSVLITGESGTGKEVVARFIHERSQRAGGPFVGVNCAAIPEHMMEATLFGHEKGAFTGAHQARPGKFEVCEGGTLLLDEISEMGLDLQAKLLRVLQEREVERIGANVNRKVDVRVLATSNRDLREEVREGRFREDLYYRLSVFPLQLQPLRERVEDILPLAELFLARHGARMGKANLRLGDASREVLLEHPWMGNVRELENAIQRALVLVDGDVVMPADLGIEAAPTAASGSGCALESHVRDAEETVIQQTLASCNGRRKEAARVLGISERTLRYKLQKLREREEFVP